MYWWNTYAKHNHTADFADKCCTLLWNIWQFVSKYISPDNGGRGIHGRRDCAEIQWSCHHMETPSALLVLCEEIPSFRGWFPHKERVMLRALMYYWRNNGIKLLVIWIDLTFMWHHCDGFVQDCRNSIAHGITGITAVLYWAIDCKNVTINSKRDFEEYVQNVEENFGARPLSELMLAPRHSIFQWTKEKLLKENICRV